MWAAAIDSVDHLLPDIVLVSIALKPGGVDVFEDENEYVSRQRRARTIQKLLAKIYMAYTFLCNKKQTDPKGNQSARKRFQGHFPLHLIHASVDE